MMSKYFAKFLPVEGEPKEIGDYYEIEKGSVGVILEKTSKPFRFRTRGLTGYFKDKEAPDNILSQKKMKLFLCSKDIEVGDEIYLPNFLMEMYSDESFDKVEVTSINEKTEVYHFQVKSSFGGMLHSGVYKYDNPYKIVGEISTEVIWIKEYDKFGQEDIKRQFYDDSGSSDSEWFDYCPLHTEEDWNETPIDQKRIQIKCSQCQNFH